MASRLGLGGLKLTLEEIGEALTLTRERIRQIQHKVTTRDQSGLVGKYQIQFPSKRRRDKGSGIPRVFGKAIILQWIKESGARWCPKCLTVKDLSLHSKTNGYCLDCHQKRNASYRTANWQHIKELKKRYAASGYVTYRDKAQVKKFS